MQITQSVERRETARRMKQEGHTYAEIAKSMHISRQRVHQLVAPSNKVSARIRMSGICEECGKKVTKLEIHHITYEPSKTKNLCTACHRHAHKSGIKKTQILFQTSTEDVDAIDRLAEIDGFSRSGWVAHIMQKVIANKLNL